MHPGLLTHLSYLIYLRARVCYYLHVSCLEYLRACVCSFMGLRLLLSYPA